MQLEFKLEERLGEGNGIKVAVLARDYVTFFSKYPPAAEFYQILDDGGWLLWGSPLDIRNTVDHPIHNYSTTFKRKKNEHPED